MSARMPSSTRDGADTKVSMSSLPSDVLQRICSFLEDPDDLASCHLVDTRFCAAARAALTSAEPQHPGFLKMALQHHYPLRHLNTAELPFCKLDSYLSKAPSSLTSLDVAERTLIQQANGSEAPRTLSMTKLLKGLSSLRSLSCPVLGRNITFLQPHLADLHTVTLHFSEQTYEFKGIRGLRNVKRLTISVGHALGASDYLMLLITELKTLEYLRLHTLEDWPLLLPLTSLSNLTALSLANALNCDGNEHHNGDETVASLVKGLPQLRAFDLGRDCAENATDAGLCKLSRLTKLQHLSLVGAFDQCTHSGLNAALATLTGLEALNISWRPFTTEHAMPGIQKLTRAITKMLAVLGPRLQRLAIRAWDRKPDSQDSLVPAVLELCPLLNRLEVSDTWPGCVGLELKSAPLTRCTQLYLQCHLPETAMTLSHVPELLRLRLQMTSKAAADFNMEASVIKVIKGLQFLAHLQHLRIDLEDGSAGQLQSVLEAAAACSRLTWLQLTAHDRKRQSDDSGPLVLGTNHLKALAALQLRVLDLRNIPWAENSISMGLVSLVAGMPCLRVLGAPDRVLHQAVDGLSEADCSYELRDLPGRRLRRWPRRATLGYTVNGPVAEYHEWPVLERHHWLWDE